MIWRHGNSLHKYIKYMFLKGSDDLEVYFAFVFDFLLSIVASMMLLLSQS